MDPQYALASKDDVWRLQNEMKNVYATQAEHADRLARLEQRQGSEGRIKSPWGTTSHSPYNGPLTGPPPQGIVISLVSEVFADMPLILDRGYNPVSEDFRNFDQNLLGSLHLDTDDVEPRRGTSRANSVRFDVSAGGHGARGSQEYLPLRTGSAFGSHPMTERSSSHKSDGRQSSAGQSVHSARASSFGYETRPLSATVPPFVPLGPPPGLFILGPVPSIIRCWLNENFRSEAMLYAAVCTGSYRSIVDSSLLTRLGYGDGITTNRDGDRVIKLPVYLPEATLKTASSRSSSPAHQLPTLTTDFFVQDLDGEIGSVQIYLGCDVLRTRNGDIHFSLDRLTLFDDERNVVSVQLVRPENAEIYQSLQTVSKSNSHVQSPPLTTHQAPVNGVSGSPKSHADTLDLSIENLDGKPGASDGEDLADVAVLPTSASPSIIGEGRKTTSTRDALRETQVKTDPKETESLTNGSTPDTPTRSEGGNNSNNIWGSWRRDSKSGNGNGADAFQRENTASNYQRPGRGRGMKILKPARSSTSRSSSIPQQPVGFSNGDPRAASDGPAPSASATSQSGESQTPAPRDKQTPSASENTKPAGTSSSGSKARPSNPIGGASAFGWLNAGQAKPTASG